MSQVNTNVSERQLIKLNPERRVITYIPHKYMAFRNIYTKVLFWKVNKFNQDFKQGLIFGKLYYHLKDD